jgi:hypothetical protein
MDHKIKFSINGFRLIIVFTPRMALDGTALTGL